MTAQRRLSLFPVCVFWPVQMIAWELTRAEIDVRRTASGATPEGSPRSSSVLTSMHWIATSAKKTVNGEIRNRACKLFGRNVQFVTMKSSPAKELLSHSPPSEEYVFSVGSTGDSPVPSGDPPDGMGSGLKRKGTVLSQAHVTAIPPGGSPGGAGGSPAPPTLNRYSEERAGEALGPCRR